MTLLAVNCALRSRVCGPASDLARRVPRVRFVPEQAHCSPAFRGQRVRSLGGHGSAEPRSVLPRGRPCSTGLYADGSLWLGDLAARPVPPFHLSGRAQCAARGGPSQEAASERTLRRWQFTDDRPGLPCKRAHAHGARTDARICGPETGKPPAAGRPEGAGCGVGPAVLSAGVPRWKEGAAGVQESLPGSADPLSTCPHSLSVSGRGPQPAPLSARLPVKLGQWHPPMQVAAGSPTVLTPCKPPDFSWIRRPREAQGLQLVLTPGPYLHLRQFWSQRPGPQIGPHDFSRTGANPHFVRVRDPRGGGGQGEVLTAEEQDPAAE